MATTLRGDDNFDTASPIPAGNFTAKAWVNFNGTGTVAIRADGNVSSITDGGVGYYTVNFTNNISDTNYAVVGTCAYASPLGMSVQTIGAATNLAGSVAVSVSYGNRFGDGYFDSDTVSVAVMR